MESIRQALGKSVARNWCYPRSLRVIVALQQLTDDVNKMKRLFSILSDS